MADFPWDGGCWDRGKRSYLCSYDWWMCSSWSTAQSIWCLWDHDLKGILLSSSCLFLRTCTTVFVCILTVCEVWLVSKEICSISMQAHISVSSEYLYGVVTLPCDFQAHCLHLGFHLVESNTALWPGKWILNCTRTHFFSCAECEAWSSDLQYAN